MYIRKIGSGAIKAQKSSVLRQMSVDAQPIIQQVAQQQKERVARIVPWFLETMPVSIA